MAGAFVPPPGEIIEFLVLDDTGQPVLTLRNGRVLVTQPDGSQIELVRGILYPLVDGTLLSVDELLSDHPPQLAVCWTCRHPDWQGHEEPCHGCLRLHNVRVCWDCGHLCCACHRSPCPEDSHWRCVRCTRRFKRREWIRWLFYREIE